MARTTTASTTRTPTHDGNEHLASLGSVELRARLLIEGLAAGLHRSPLRGLSLEFAEHRPYAPGDDLRHLDWKAYGKTDRLYLKRHHQETNVDLMLLVDTSGSMAYRSDNAPWSKYDAAITLVTALTLLALNQHDRAGIQTFGSLKPTQLPVSSSRSQWLRAAHTLEHDKPQPRHRNNDDPEPPKAEDLARAVTRLDAQLTRRSIVIILSDLFDEPDAIQRALARLRFAGHDVMLLQVIDPAERAFPFSTSSEFDGLEAEGKQPIDPALVAPAYRSIFEQHLTSITRAAAAMSFDHLLLETDRPMIPALRHALALRSSTAQRRG
ncbi:DUF58 domain-containing protein [Mucisphaera calidilacus]|uniref:VWA domain containing CoxE-like protein n=1 Tax=Mucisphaera calidilacus TaxID=2527982 RepID=A0A518C0V8_9BACT|nr:DUF58 domain-containing protein [Mucisphaera calidilacus]QDU72867.1 VWA domain containing CoxE-like protein [Mucisphaera calidilacus]